MRLLLVLLWLIPAVVLVRKNSPWTPIAAVALTLSAAGFLFRRGPKARPGPVTPSVEPLVITPPTDAPPRRELIYLACAGALINAAMLAEGTRNSVAAGMYLVIATAIILARSSYEQRERFAARNQRASAALAVLLTIFGMMRWGMRRWLPTDDNQAGAVEASTVVRPTDDVSFRGVMLFVEKPAERIVPPAPLSLQKGFADPKQEPLVIPFSGVYWFMRAPDRMPPPTALVQHGSPDELFFRVNDRRPLVMEAHQSLGRHIDLSCCAGLDVDIVNVDRYPGSVLIEVRLGYQGLGVQPVQSTQFMLYGGDIKPRQETLHFPIAPGRFGSFDEITVRFHLQAPRSGRSARMAIQRFVLRPRR